MADESSNGSDRPESARAAAKRGRTKEGARSASKLAEKRGRLKELARQDEAGDQSADDSSIKGEG